MDAVAEAPTAEGDVRVTDSAFRRIGEILKEEPEMAALRVAVEGGGCSGFQYRYDLVAGAEPDDTLFVRDGATVVIDPISMEYLKGSEIDFVTDLMGQAFQIRNPNATSSCGCGTSFSLF